MIDLPVLRDMIKLHEGYGAKAYKDSRGILTIGYGRNLRDKGLTEEEWNMLFPSGISPEQAAILLEHDIDEVIEWISTYPWWTQVSPNRQMVLIDMAFNLGKGKFSAFHKMIGAIADGEYKLAAEEMRNSEWFNQVGKRAENDILLMQHG